VISAALHAGVAAVAWWAIDPRQGRHTEVVDIEVAPTPPKPEALPAEVARPPQPDLADRQPDPQPESTPPGEPGEGMVDAGVDAQPDAAVDARPDARPDAAVDARPDAAIDASIDAAPDAPTDAGPGAGADGGADDASEPVPVATTGDAGDDAGGAPRIAIGETPGDAAQGSAGEPASDAAPGGVQVAAGSGSGETPATGAATAGSGDAHARGTGSGAPLDTAALAAALAAGSGAPVAADEPAVEGEPTTAGTAANLLAYFPDGHVVTALIRFDRLRGTEWSAQAERLLRPLPDYRWLFGSRDANITDKLETLVISTPRPRDAAATTLVARTLLPRPALREFLAATTPVTWSVATGGLLGKRTGKLLPGDRRVLLSPFRGWFLLAQPGDLGALTAAGRGNPDTIEASAKLPPWLAGIRKIEAETGDVRGPAAVVTLGLGGKRIELGDNDLGLGIPSIPTPDRVSLAMELVPQGWLVRGNMRFASDADAAELIAAVQRAQQRIADSRLIQRVIGKATARVIANLAFARSGARVSYATSISISDARAILAAAAQQLDQYFARAP
jgi:hypothetical protein